MVLVVKKKKVKVKSLIIRLCHPMDCSLPGTSLHGIFQARVPGWAVMNLPANEGDIEMRVSSLGKENSLEEDMATYSSILAWRIVWTEEAGRLQSIGLQRVGHD